jgi:hypothetical protein
MSAIAYVVSDYPIVASGVRRTLEATYSVIDLTWSAREERSLDDASLVVLDVTGVSAHTVLSVVSGLQSSVRVAVSSLDHNEVDVYLVDRDGLARLSELPSLLSLKV